MATGQRKAPARLLKDLIGQMGSSELSDWRPDILRIVDEFTKTPRKELLAILDGRNRGRSDSGRREAGIARSPESPSISPVSPLVIEFRHALDELRERHIFQWSTFYRDCLDSYFDRYLDAMGRPSPDDPVRALADPLADHAHAVLDDALYALRSKLEAKSPITYNFAREFPLHHRDKASFFHVIRTSVRDLLRTFERRNGVRLWCSIKRSGKTTACFDMETTTGDSVIIGQTCGAPPTENIAVFYKRVRDAVGAGRMVSDTFVQEVIAECASVEINDRRTVLIIDEYETLFGLLKNAVKDNGGLRYSVVQPIAAAAALSEQGYRDNRLFEVYWVLRELSSAISGVFGVSRSDFQEAASHIPIPKGGHPSDCSELLRAASQANFLSHDDHNVNVRIRALGRIAAAVRPALA